MVWGFLPLIYVYQPFHGTSKKIRIFIFKFSRKITIYQLEYVFWASKTAKNYRFVTTFSIYGISMLLEFKWFSCKKLKLYKTFFLNIRNMWYWLSKAVCVLITQIICQIRNIVRIVFLMSASKAMSVQHHFKGKSSAISILIKIIFTYYIKCKFTYKCVSRDRAKKF